MNCFPCCAPKKSLSKREHEPPPPEPVPVKAPGNLWMHVVDVFCFNYNLLVLGICLIKVKMDRFDN